jgi:UDP-glucose 4-epimerase
MTMPRWLITGGAGYLGAHIVDAVQAAGYEPVALDDFTTGYRGRIQSCKVIDSDLSDPSALAEHFTRNNISVIIHAAGIKAPSVAREDPVRFYHANVVGSFNLIKAAQASKCRHLVFTSSATVYTSGDDPPGTTSDRATPYSHCKRIIERILESTCATSDLRASSLRCFNVSGYEREEQYRANEGLIALAARNALAGITTPVFHSSTPTSDGSCIRDYVHVADVAEAHVHIAELLRMGADVPSRMDIGTGTPTTAIEVLDALADVSGASVPRELVASRASDVPDTPADSDFTEVQVGWTAKRNVRDIVESEWLVAQQLSQR